MLISLHVTNVMNNQLMEMSVYEPTQEARFSKAHSKVFGVEFSLCVHQ